MITLNLQVGLIHRRAAISPLPFEFFVAFFFCAPLPRPVFGFFLRSPSAFPFGFFFALRRFRPTSLAEKKSPPQRRATKQTATSPQPPQREQPRPEPRPRKPRPPSSRQHRRKRQSKTRRQKQTSTDRKAHSTQPPPTHPTTSKHRRRKAKLLNPRPSRRRHTRHQRLPPRAPQRQRTDQPRTRRKATTATSRQPDGKTTTPTRNKRHTHEEHPQTKKNQRQAPTTQQAAGAPNTPRRRIGHDAAREAGVIFFFCFSFFVALGCRLLPQAVAATMSVASLASERT